MGTRRKVCVWYKRRKHEYVVEPPGWKPRDGDIVFTDQNQMISFAHGIKAVLKERQNGRQYA